MEELITTRQLQEHLKVNRITVYRMLNDGRLKGIKVGNQWRFPRSLLDDMLGGFKETLIALEKNEIRDFPSDCIIKVQQLFAGLLGIGAVIISTQGQIMQTPYYSNPFCEHMLRNPDTRHRCQRSWQNIGSKEQENTEFQACHAGLNCLRAPIVSETRTIAWLTAGQYRLSTKNHPLSQHTLQELADLTQIPVDELEQAYHSVPVLDDFQRRQIVEWTPKVAQTIQSILQERKQIMDRLQRISELSTIEKPLPE